MRKALLLSGLQRNFLPFVKNQLELLINGNNFDIFISTSSENTHRCSDENGRITYKDSLPINSDHQYFKQLYGESVKEIIIDDGSLYDKFREENNIPSISKFHEGLIKSYLKVHLGIKLIEKYETENNIKYDFIIRARLDCFLLGKLDFNHIFGTLRYNEFIFNESSQNHKDDSCFICYRDHLHIFRDFVFHVVKKAVDIFTFNSPEEINIEITLFNYCWEKGFFFTFNQNIICRIGCPSDLKYKNVPFFQKEDINNLSSREYPIDYD